MDLLIWCQAFATTAPVRENKGVFAWIGNLFISLLEWLYDLTAAIGFPNWVLTIFLFTVIVKILFQPFMNKQMRSTRKMQLLAPEVEDLKRRYGNNQQKLSMETMKLYKEHGASPTAGCLPLLLQMPILIALFNAIRAYTPEDMSTFVAPLFGIDGSTIALADGTEVVLNLATASNQMPGLMGWVLPVLTGAATFLQQWLSTANRQDKQQRTMMIVMPLMFLWFARPFPALIAFYWIFYSLIGAAIMFPLMKYWEKKDRVQIEAARRAKEEEAERRRLKKAAAREAAAQRKQQRSGQTAYAVEEDDFAEDALLDEEDEEKAEQLAEEREFRQYLIRKGMTVKRKRMRLHPYSPEDEVVELAVLPNGSELELADVRAQFQAERRREQQTEQLRQMSGFGRLLGKRKKDADGPADADGGKK